MSDEDAVDRLQDALLYHAAYSHARDRLESDAYSMQYGRYRGKPVADLVAAVAKHCGVNAQHPTIAEAVEDAVAGRKPRW